MSVVQQATIHGVLLDQDVRTYYAAHSEDGEWFFGGPGFLDEPDEAFRGESVAHLIARDPTVMQILDLPFGWHAWRDEPTDPWQRYLLPVGPTFVLTYEVRPTEAVPEYGTIGGAYVNCWIKTRSLHVARRQARRELRDDGWLIIKKVLEWEAVPGQMHILAEQFYRQVQIDGSVFVFNNYSLEDEDEDVEASPSE
jgi:hypothetical protein